MKKYAVFTLNILLICLIFFLFFIKKSDKKYNIILISLDLLQAKQLHSYGYPLNTTPNLDNLLDRSYLFTNAITTSSWTTPSTMSIFTSMYPVRHQVIHKYTDYDLEAQKGTYSHIKTLNPQALTLAEILKKNGYTTAAFTGNGGVDPHFGFNEGFEVYYAADKTVTKTRTFVDAAPKASAWLEKNKDKQFFLFLQGFDLHNIEDPVNRFDYRYLVKPYSGKYQGFHKDFTEMKELALEGKLADFTREDWEFWQAVYNEKINNADRALKVFFQTLKKLNLLDASLIVFTSAHGQEFYEHKAFGHGWTLYDESIHVPFAIKLPNQSKQYRINTLVSGVDIMPTILGILKIRDPVPWQTQGINLAPLLKNQNLQIKRDVYSETNYRNWVNKYAIQTSDGWKLIVNTDRIKSEKELFYIKNDPKELYNLAGKEKKILYELERKLTMYQTGK